MIRTVSLITVSAWVGIICGPALAMSDVSKIDLSRGDRYQFPLPPQPPLPSWVTSAPKGASVAPASLPTATSYFSTPYPGTTYISTYGATQSFEAIYYGNPCLYGNNSIGETWTRCPYSGGYVITNMQSPSGKCGVNGAQCDPAIP